MRFLTSIILSLAVSALALSFLAKAEYDDRLEAGAADGLVLKDRGEVGPETCDELAESVDVIRTKTTTTIVLAVAALDVKKALSMKCLTYSEADARLKELRTEFNSRYESEERKYRSSNMVSKLIRFYENPFAQPDVGMPERAERAGLFELSIDGEGI